MATNVAAPSSWSQDCESNSVPELTPTLDIILQSPPPLDPAWLAHEKAAGLLSKPVSTEAKAHQAAYTKECRHRNAYLLSGRDEHLNHGIYIHDTFIETNLDTNYLANVGERKSNIRDHKIPIRSYNPPSSPSGPSFRNGHPENPEIEGQDIVIYYHGGGLMVGDLDSEDLTCRRICKDLSCTVYSCEYRLMPDYTADHACDDALQAFMAIAYLHKARRLIVAGSSSGGQLAAMVAGSYGRTHGVQFLPGLNRPASESILIDGVLLRGPVTCDASDGGVNIPAQFRPFHTSMRPEFHTSLASKPAVTASNRTTRQLPLEYDDFGKMPRHWIQVSTNDIYYSDGVLYAQALKQAGVEVRLDIVHGFPHTFWLKAPELERAVKAEKDMIEGLRWLLANERC